MNRIASTVVVAVALSFILWGLGWVVFETFKVDSPTYYQNTMYLCLGLIWFGVAWYLKRVQGQTPSKTETRQTPPSLEIAKETETGDTLDQIINAIGKLDGRFADTHAFLEMIAKNPQIRTTNIERSLSRIENRLGIKNLIDHENGEQSLTPQKEGGEQKRES